VLIKDKGTKAIVLKDFNEEVLKVIKHFKYSEKVIPFATMQVAGFMLTKLLNRRSQR
jgi:hypothetical protein